MDPLFDDDSSEYGRPETGSWTRGRCEVCGEPYDLMSPRPSLSEVGEFWDPGQPNRPSVTCHAQCGLDRGLELA